MIFPKPQEGSCRNSKVETNLKGGECDEHVAPHILAADVEGPRTMGMAALEKMVILPSATIEKGSQE